MRSDVEITGELLLLIPTSTPKPHPSMVAEASRIMGP